jgi:lysophospholipase L1-like esterase
MPSFSTLLRGTKQSYKLQVVGCRLWGKVVSFALLGLMLITNSVNAQKVTWDSVSRPEIYNPQVEQFRTFKRSANDIVFLGNSITHWTNWNELLGISNGKNRGIPGDVTYGVIDRLDEALKGSPKKIFIMIGINDVARNVPDEVILNNYQRIISSIKRLSPRTKIYFQTILPTNPSFKKLLNHYKNDHVVNINAGLKQLATKNKITFIDVYSAFIDDQQMLKKEYTYDGVHLTGKGYEVWATLLKKGNYLKD